MQPLGTYNLTLDIVIVVAMPILIWANVGKKAASNPFNAYLWAEHPTFMRVSLVILGLLALNSAAALLAHLGVFSGPVRNGVSIAIGVPFLIAAVAEIILAGRAVMKVVRDRRSPARKS